MNMLLQLSMQVPSALVDDLTVYLSQNVPYGWQEEEIPGTGVRFTVHLEETTAAEAVALGIAAKWPEITVDRAEVQELDWAEAWKEFFTPVKAGGTFIVLPPWRKDEVPEGFIPILIAPKQAFGTGHHGSTALCLSAIATLFKKGVITKGQRFLDLGTGSGILGLGSCKLGLLGIGLDIDPLAIENAQENKPLNQIGDEFDVGVGSLDLLEKGQTFDLVLANILSGPLMDMAPELIARVAPGGSLVLSGILIEQGPAVSAAYQAQGLGEPGRQEQDEWTSLVWERIGE